MAQTNVELAGYRRISECVPIEGRREGESSCVRMADEMADFGKRELVGSTYFQQLGGYCMLKQVPMAITESLTDMGR